MFRKIELKNKLKIILVPQKTTQAVTILMLVGTGSKYETKKTNGISHFLEHIFFKGTRKRPSPTAVAETLDKIGGIYNAFTSQDYTGYFAKVEASKFDLAFDWVTDIFLNSTLPAKEIAKEKGVIIEEINMRQDSPMEYVQILWDKLLYGDQPAGWDIAGTKENVMRFSRQQLYDYRQTQYVPGKTILCLAGNFEEKKAINLCKKYFSGLKTKKPLPKQAVIEKQDRPMVLLKEKQTDQTHLCLGVRAYNLFHTQRFAQEILGLLLGGMMSSRLFVAVREKLGLAYYIKTDSAADPDTGYLVTQAGVKNEKVDKAISVILAEYKKIRDKQIPKTELKKAKDNLKGKMALALEASDAKASFYGAQELLEKRILTPKEIFQKIDKVKAEDISKIARDIFRPDKLNLALIGPFKDKNKFEKLLKL